MYGVDIELSATDITKLRFWLSLIVDEEDIKQIRPLPNLDNQIMCGNSVIDNFEGIKLFDDSLIKDRFGQTTLVIKPSEIAFEKLESKKQEFFNEKYAESHLINLFFCQTHSSLPIVHASFAVILQRTHYF